MYAFLGKDKKEKLRFFCEKNKRGDGRVFFAAPCVGGVPRVAISAFSPGFMEL